MRGMICPTTTGALLAARSGSSTPSSSRRRGILSDGNWMTGPMHIPALIEKKRDGGVLDAREIESLIGGYVRGEVPDYQMAAFAMAVFFRGMNSTETTALTLQMRDSGDVFRWPAGTPPKVDKHSTGGVGDKVSLILAPLLACEGVWVPMVSGRGLGFTGGTLDKLESIPGWRFNLSWPEMLAQLERVGCFITGQTASFCPADKKLYALRDVTGTVASLPLIVASIMSKKLAESLDRLVLDVKFGRGAFMKTREDARRLADAMVAVGREAGVDTHAMLNPMDEPLGCTAGNALEVAECVDVLRGGGPEDLIDLTLALAAKLVSVPMEKLAGRLKDGSAWEKFVAMIQAQGGDAAALGRMREIHRAPVITDVMAPATGKLAKLDALEIGRLCVELGAGRAKADDSVDFAVGVECLRKQGADVVCGERLLRVHSRRPVDAPSVARRVLAIE
ncbi:MAG: thymidine phosphorylase [Chthoniobacterales bacterium]|nr:thymidine phosphorylase [Chthoniobacterales bacterium]